MFSTLSFGSIGSAGSFLSIGSAGSILSVGSAGSILSIGSTGSLFGLGEHRSRPPAAMATALATLAIVAAWRDTRG